METNISPMACGNCGHGLFKMFKQDLVHGFALIAECTACKSTTRIETRPAELTLEFGEGSGGRLCSMSPKTESVRLSAWQLSEARERVGNAAFDRLTVPPYSAIDVEGAWSPAGPDAVTRTLRLGNEGSTHTVQAQLIVRFLDDASTTMQEAYVLLEPSTILASLSPEALLPNGNSD